MATLTMTRRFSAPLESVFAAITQTGFLLQWWGPEGTTIRDHDLDFTRMGPWYAVMVGPQGHPAKVGGDVLIVNPPRRVTLTLSFLDENDQPLDHSTITFELAPDDRAGTVLSLTQSGLKEEYIPDMKNKGWNSALQRLEALLKQT